MFCGEFSLVKRSSPETTIIPLLCHCWTCERCRPGRKRRLVEEALAGAPTLFITLTSRRRELRFADWAAQDLAHAWRTVRAEYLRAHGPRSLDFMVVFEATKKGWPHLHIVARAKWVDQRWLSKRMAALIGSPIVYVERIKHTKTIAAYVAKYIGKNPHRFQGVKRYWRSLRYLTPVPLDDSPDDPQEPVWTIVRRYAVCLRDEMIAQGYAAEESKGGWVLRPAPS